MTPRKGIFKTCQGRNCCNPVHIRPCEPNKKFCSPECAGGAGKGKPHKNQKTVFEKICQNCSGEYPAKHANSKYCSQKCAGEARRGKCFSPRMGTSEKCLGKDCPNTVYVKPHQKENKKFCSKECADKSRRGVILPEIRIGIYKKCRKETCPNLIYVMPCSETRRHYCSLKCKDTDYLSCADAPRRDAMGRKPYREWRKAVFARDGHKCTKCGATDKLEVDHIVGWLESVELRYDVSNGRVLCKPCHTETPNYGAKAIQLAKLAKAKAATR